MRRSRSGFTLIELLVAVVVLGILVAMAFPRATMTKDKAKLATVKSDLHAIEVSQEAHYSAYGTYGTKNQLTKRTNFQPSPGNTFSVSATSSGYTATVTNASITKKQAKKCSVTVGSGAAPGLDGVYVCS